MRFWTAERVAAALGTTLEGDGFTAVETDTRSLPDGCLFVALGGDRFDGHAFLEEARDQGATGAVVRRGTPAVAGLHTLEVDDTLVALGQLAHERRRAVPGPVIAITGTNGKTATREMMSLALGTRWRVHATRENRNNLVGVPLTLLEAPMDTEALVVELGASERGEISRLRDVIEPTIAIVTNVSVGHVEGFGSLAATLEEKAALLDGARLAVVGTEPVDLATEARARARRVIVAGSGQGADVSPVSVSLARDGTPSFDFRGTRVILPLPGRHQVANAILALAVAEELGLSLNEVVDTLTEVSVPPGRCEVIQHGDLMVLHDAYNSNPASLAASLETAAAMRGDRPLVVVLGTMLELGGDSAGWHGDLAEGVLEHEPQLIAVTGEFIPAFASHREALGPRLIQADDPTTLGRLVASRLEGNELVLVKASHGVHLDRVLPFIIPDSDRQCSTTS